jgi:hypothetical protein
MALIVVAIRSLRNRMAMIRHDYGDSALALIVVAIRSFRTQRGDDPLQLICAYGVGAPDRRRRRRRRRSEH